MDLRLCTLGAKLELQPTDIMPMINIVLNNSFADAEGNCIAIVSAGWNPFTEILLLHPVLCRTMSDYDRQQELTLDLVNETKL